MRSPEQGLQWRVRAVRKGAFRAAAWLLGFGVFAFVASRYMHGRTLMATLVFVECAALAGAVAWFAVELDPRELGVRRFLFRMSLACVILLAASAVVLTIAAAAWGAMPWSGGLTAQLVILSFCLLLASVFALVRCSGSELLFAQLVCIFVACALMGTVFYADPIVEAQKSPEARSVVIRAVLVSNPITAISWSLLEVDLLRRQVMYDRLSVIGGSYPFAYPKWWKTLGGYVVISCVMLAGAGVLRRHRALRSPREGGSER